jgi:protein ImuB
VTPTAVRTLVVGCPDWPLVALGVVPDEPVLVLGAGRVVAATGPARAVGVARGQRRREAQFLCPEVQVLARDEGREARGFEAVVSALGTVTPWVEARRPGRCSFGVRGPVRLFGGESALVRHTAEVVDAAVARVGAGVSAGTAAGPGCRIGVADGAFAAGLAARSGGAAPEHSVIVPRGGSPAFLVPLPVEVLLPGGSTGLVDLLVRLGLTTLGAFAALPVADVLARFGTDGLDAHRLASGIDDRPVGHRPAPPDLAVSVAFDPPVDRIDRAAFAARSAAEALHERLSARGMACTRVVVEAETEHGQRVSRRWRDEGVLGPAAVADRVRWQLEGWLHGPPAVRPTSGITRLVLAPDEVVPASGRQLGFWGGVSAADERAGRACARVVGLMGPGSVRIPEWRGGRDPDDRVALVPFVEPLWEGGSGGSGGSGACPGRGPGRGGKPEVKPWPGALPGPSPAAVHFEPVAIDVVDAAGAPVGVDGRGGLSAPPDRLIVSRPPAGSRLAAAPGERVVAWAGPWPVDERWWDPLRRRRRVRLQVVTADGTAFLVVLTDGRWTVAATYD